MKLSLLCYPIKCNNMLHLKRFNTNFMQTVLFYSTSVSSVQVQEQIIVDSTNMAR